MRGQCSSRAQFCGAWLGPPRPVYRRWRHAIVFMQARTSRPYRGQKYRNDDRADAPSPEREGRRGCRGLFSPCQRRRRSILRPPRAAAKEASCDASWVKQIRRILECVCVCLCARAPASLGPCRVRQATFWGPSFSVGGVRVRAASGGSARCVARAQAQRSARSGRSLIRSHNNGSELPASQTAS